MYCAAVFFFLAALTVHRFEEPMTPDTLFVIDRPQNEVYQTFGAGPAFLSDSKGGVPRQNVPSTIHRCADGFGLRTLIQLLIVKNGFNPAPHFSHVYVSVSVSPPESQLTPAC